MAAPRLAHNVFFKLKDNSPAKVQALVDACKKYLNVQPGIVFFAAGQLCAGPRPRRQRPRLGRWAAPRVRRQGRPRRLPGRRDAQQVHRREQGELGGGPRVRLAGVRMVVCAAHRANPHSRRMTLPRLPVPASTGFTGGRVRGVRVLHPGRGRSPSSSA